MGHGYAYHVTASDQTPESRDQALENIVDRLDENVAEEREDKDVPGKPSDRARGATAGSLDDREPPD